MTSKALAKRIARMALTKKAHAVTILDLRKLTDMADFFVVCSADSDVQVKAVADAVADGTDEIGIAPWHREGLSQRQWILLDYVDVVVHIFHNETRRYYAIEKLWGDAKIEVVEDTPVKTKPRKARTRSAARVGGRKTA